MHRLGIVLVALAALFAIAFSGAASAATSGPTREEFSSLKSRVSKLEEVNKASLERNAKLDESPCSNRGLPPKRNRR